MPGIAIFLDFRKAYLKKAYFVFPNRLFWVSEKSLFWISEKPILDFRKAYLLYQNAFDTIKWNYLLSTLRLFNFGLDIQIWIEVIYHNVSSCVLNNGHASPFFQ